MKVVKKSLWAGLFLVSVPLWACNSSHVLGAGGSGAVYTMSADTMEEGGFYLGINSEGLKNHPLSDAAILKAVENGAEHIHSVDAIYTHSLSFSYGITDLLTLNMQLPYVSRKNIRAGEHHDHEDHQGHGHEEGEIHSHGDAEGLGDLSAILQYKVYDADKLKIALLAGIKAPTGKTDIYDGDERLETDLQPGSGSWDYFAGAAFTKDLEDFSLHSSFLYKYNTEDDYATRLGDVFNYNVAFAYKLIGEDHDDHLEELHMHTDFEYSVDFFVELNGEVVQADQFSGIDIDNTGHHVIYAATGLQLLTESDYSAFIALSAPVYQNMEGIQNEIQYKASIGIGKSF